MNVKRILATKGRHVHTISPQASLREAIIMLHQHRIGALVVSSEEGQVVGILSERDIIRYAAGHDDIFSTLVEVVMTADVITGAPEDDVHAVAHIMTEKRFRHLPILESGALMGIISIGDVMKAQRDMYRGEIDTMETQLMADASS